MSVFVITTAKLPKLQSTQKMVDTALKSLADNNGSRSSLVAVKKYIACNYDIDVEASSKRIKMCIKANLEGRTSAKTLGRKGQVGAIKLSARSKPKVRIAGVAKEVLAADDGAVDGSKD